MLALLCRDGMGGFNGYTPEQYARTSDHVILTVYFARRDRKGRLIPEWKLARKGRKARGDGPTGDPEFAAFEMPSAESLEIPAEVWKASIPMDFCISFFDVWRTRGYDAAGRLEKWREFLREEGRG